MLGDGDCRGGVVAGHPIRGVEVEQVVERRPRAGQLGRVGDGARAVGRLTVDRRALVGILPVAQVVHLFQDQRQAPRECVARDLVQVGRDLGVIGGHGTERIGGQLGSQLRRHVAQCLELRHDPTIVLRAGHRGHAGRVTRRGPKQRGPAHVDHLDRHVDADHLAPDLGREGLDVDDDQVDQADPLLDQLLQLFRDVAPGEDAGIDRGVERLDLATDERGDVRQLGDGGNVDAVGGKVLAGAIGREHLDAEHGEFPGEFRDSVPVRH